MNFLLPIPPFPLLFMDISKTTVSRARSNPTDKPSSHLTHVNNLYAKHIIRSNQYHPNSLNCKNLIFRLLKTIETWIG